MIPSAGAVSMGSNSFLEDMEMMDKLNVLEY